MIRTKIPFEMASAPFMGMDRQGLLTVPRPMQVVLVGAGGTGGRVAMLLPKLLSPTMKLHIFDPDVVETRNLLRQHFHPRDVGMNKALAIGSRLRALMDPEHLFVHPEPFTLRSLDNYTTGNTVTILLGCVDNHAARVAMHEYWRMHSSCAYLDAGNETRYGQVVLSLNQWLGTISPGFLSQGKTGRAMLARGAAVTASAITYDGMQRHAPGLLVAPPVEPEACGMRIDTQTVAANQIAATTLTGLLAMLLDGLPISQPFFEFCTAPPTIQPTVFHSASAWKMQHQRSWWG